MKRVLSLLLCLSFLTPALGQPGVPGIGWHNGGDVVTNDMPFITVSLQPGMTNERALSTVASFPELQIIDNGPNSTIQLGWSGQLPLTRGGTGASTQQGAVNNILNFPSLASGDTIYYNGTNWVRLAKGADGTILQLSSGLPIWASGTGAVTIPYLTVGNDATLSAERAIAAGNGLSGSDGGANGSYTLSINTAVTADLATAQTLAGPKTLSAGPKIAAATTTGLVMLGTSFNDTIIISDPAAARTLTIPDPGANASFVMTAGAQSIGGVKTLTSQPIFPSTGIRFNPAGGNVDIVPTNPAASRILTLPDPGADASFVMTEGAQTANGVKTFGNQPVFPSSGIKIKTSGANSYIISGTNPSADRTYNLYDSGGNNDIAIKSGTPTSGAVAYGDGNKILFSGGGTDGQWLKRVSGAPTWTSLPGSFGGDGSDGAITISGATSYNGPLQKNASTFTVNSSQTLTCDTGSPIIINCTSTFTVNGTITMTAAGGAGGRGASASVTVGDSGAGPGGGHFSVRGSSDGGGGGGFGGRGGRGAYSGGATYAGPAGQIYNGWIVGGSGGAGGGQTTGAGGDGGTGGSALIVCATGAITVASTGTITCSGAAGAAGGSANAGGAGGGSGGLVLLASQTSVTCQASSTVTCSGGNGGACNGIGGGGGGGGAGRRIAWSPSNTLSGTTTLAGGSGGAGGGGGGTGEAGASGTAQSITGTPNAPLLTWMMDGEGASCLTQIADMHEIMNPGTEQEITQRDLARIYAKGRLDKYAEALTPGMSDVTVLNEDEGMKDAA